MVRVKRGRIMEILFYWDWNLNNPVRSLPGIIGKVRWVDFPSFYNRFSENFFNSKSIERDPEAIGTWNGPEGIYFIIRVTAGGQEMVILPLTLMASENHSQHFYTGYSSDNKNDERLVHQIHDE
jgi:hypothetical protein